MSHFSYVKRVLHAEGVPLPAIAEAVGTPAYVYSASALREHFQAVTRAFEDHPHLVCYAVKANSTLAVLRLLAQEGSGFDIVSGGELARVKAAGGSAGKTVFAGVGKTAEEMAQALAAGILFFNVESAEELAQLDAVARAQGRKAPFALRVNPNVDARTHRYIATGLKTARPDLDVWVITGDGEKFFSAGADLNWMRRMADYTRDENIADAALLELATPGPDPELTLLKHRFAPEFKAALEAALRELPARERNFLRLFFLEGLTVEQIARMDGTHKSTVSRRMASAREQVLGAMRRQLQERLALSGSELDSLVGQLRSQLDVSLARALE